ncbi:enoyl-CoA hydratase-related protein [Streptomyces lydicus]|uniref:enoyl-CoA hydratase-related protein n=1 Tax=Streptomyces lydicus TaxID=47763 RepID=UPI00341230D6
MTRTVDYRQSDGIATITLNRPEQRNAINLRMCDEMTAVLEEFEADRQARAAVLTGAGQAFSAGADLKAFAAGEGPRIAGHKGGFGGFVRYPRTKPVIAAVNGHALAGGLELVLASDLAVASSQALLGVPEVTVGLLAGGGGAIHLPVDIGLKAAMRLLLTGRPVSADQALQLGLVNEVVAPDDVYATALELAGQIRDASPLGVAATLRVARAVAGGLSTEKAWRLNEEALSALFVSEDAAEGRLAFTEKRKPSWSGR